MTDYLHHYNVVLDPSKAPGCPTAHGPKT